MLPVRDISIADRAIFDCTIYFVLNCVSALVETPCLIFLKIYIYVPFDYTDTLLHSDRKINNQYISRTLSLWC